MACIRRKRLGLILERSEDHSHLQPAIQHNRAKSRRYPGLDQLASLMFPLDTSWQVPSNRASGTLLSICLTLQQSVPTSPLHPHNTEALHSVLSIQSSFASDFSQGETLFFQLPFTVYLTPTKGEPQLVMGLQPFNSLFSSRPRITEGILLLSTTEYACMHSFILSFNLSCCCQHGFTFY